MNRSPRRSLLSMLVPAALAVALAAASVAAEKEPIQARQDAMEAQGAAMKALGAIARKEAPFEAAVVRQNAETIASGLAAVAELFPEGSDRARSRPGPGPRSGRTGPTSKRSGRRRTRRRPISPPSPTRRPSRPRWAESATPARAATRSTAGPRSESLSRRRRRIAGLAAVALLALLAFLILTRPRAFETGPLPPASADLANGELVFRVGGCLACHAAPAGTPGAERALPTGERPCRHRSAPSTRAT